MKKIYSVASIIYRLALGIFIPISIYAIAMVSSAGHDANIGEAFLTSLFIATTISVLTIYQNIDEERSSLRKLLRYILIVLVLVTIYYECSWIYETWFVCKCFAGVFNITNLIIFIFGFISTTVLIGILKYKL